MGNNENIEIRKVLDIIFSKKLFILVILITSLLIGYLYSYKYKTPVYSSSVTLLLVTDENEEQKEITQTDLTLNSGLISTYSSIAKSAKIMNKIIDNLKIDMSINELENNITVKEIENTQFIKISVINSNPEMAKNIANELAKVFCDEIKEIYNLQNINIIDEAEIAKNPCNINHLKDMFLFLFVGVAISGTLVIFIYFMDDTIKDEKDIEKNLKLSFIGKIPVIEKQENGLVIENNPKSYIVECLKTIRTNMLYSKNKKTFLITSAREKEGKSIILNNIAVTFAQANKKVIIVDTNLRKEDEKTELFNIEKGEGLSDFIKEVSEDKLENLKLSKKYIKETKIPNLHILTNGTLPPNPSELVTSNNMKKILKLLRTMYDIVLLDGTPSLVISDSIALSSMVDSTILVVENKSTKINEIKNIKKSIEDVNGSILGVILNKANLSDKKYYGKSYGYYYGEEIDDKEFQKDNQRFISIDEIIEIAEEKIKQEVQRQQDSDIKVLSEVKNIDELKEENQSNNKAFRIIKNVFDKILRIENKLKHNESEKNEIKDSILKQEETNKEIFNEIEKIKEEQEKMSTSFSSSNKEIKQYNSETNARIDLIVNTNREMNQKIDVLSENSSKVNEKINSIVEDNIETNTRINSIIEKNNIMNSKINFLSEANNEINESINSLKEEKNIIVNEINRLEEQRKEEIKDLRENNSKVNEKINSIVEDNIETNTRIDSLVEKNNKTNTKVDLLEKNSDELNETINLLKQEENRIESEINELKQYRKEIDLLREDNDKIVSEINILEQKRKDEMTAIKENSNEVNSRVNILSENTSRINAKVNTLIEKDIQIDNRLKQFENEINLLKEEKAEIENGINELKEHGKEINVLKLEVHRIEEDINILEQKREEEIRLLTENSKQVNSKVDLLDESTSETNKKVSLLAQENIEIKSSMDLLRQNDNSIIQDVILLKKRTENLETSIQYFKALKYNIDKINHQIETLEEIQTNQLIDMKEQINILQQVQERNKIELFERIAEIDYEEKLLELEQKVLNNKQEYSKIIEQLENNKKERKNNIISFEELKEKKVGKAKTVFSIDDEIRYEDLARISNCVINLNENIEDEDIMFN